MNSFVSALDSVLTAGENVISANVAGQTSAPGNNSSATPAASSSTTPAASSSTTPTPSAAASVFSSSDAASYDYTSSAYDPANGAGAAGDSQIVNGVQLIPGGPDWDPNAASLQSDYTGIQSTWDSLNSMAAPSASVSSTGTYNWENSVYDPANDAAVTGESQFSNGVQLIPGGPGWNPDAPGLQSIYSGIQNTWNTVNITS